MKRVLITAAAVLALGGALVFAAGARAAGAALHPARKHVAAICPCIAHVQCRDASVTAADGVKSRGWYFEPDSPNGAAVLVLHGIGGSRQDVVAVGTVFERAGYAVLEPDIRGHGESGGLATYGASDEQDVHAWASWLLHQPHVERIYGFGASLGASVLLEGLNQEHRFRAVIAESAYTSFPAIANERMVRLMPTGLKWITAPLVDSGIFWAHVRYSTDLGKASALEAVRHTHTPILLIHGLADDKTSPENSRELQAANPSDVQLWLVPGSHHADAWATTGKQFETRVLNWYREH
ncbi:MAG: alpha/beta fold hydrolase [Terriglobia bacterium]